MLRQMLCLTFITALSNEITSGTFLQFDVIHFCDAARWTAHHSSLCHNLICARFININIVAAVKLRSRQELRMPRTTSYQPKRATRLPQEECVTNRQSLSVRETLSPFCGYGTYDYDQAVPDWQMHISISRMLKTKNECTSEIAKLQLFCINLYRCISFVPLEPA